ncbi:MAG: type II toxin-antitoxin system HicB family antitoxin, partial [Elusimicrobiota bacterium]|nr:type II toxin-antitoxin system HicB family antitoxin [Elusimicrobiota bacterium]
IPKPRTLEQIKISNDGWYDFENAIITTIPYITHTDKLARINITISQNLLNKIDVITKNRSAFLASLASQYLEKNNHKYS